MAICRNHCVLLHCFLSSRSDAFDDSNGYCVRNLVWCWNRINQPLGWLVSGQKLDFPAIAGMFLICAGVLVINIFSKSSRINSKRVSDIWRC
jgi:hypothetical protein